MGMNFEKGRLGQSAVPYDFPYSEDKGPVGLCIKLAIAGLFRFGA